MFDCLSNARAAIQAERELEEFWKKVCPRYELKVRIYEDKEEEISNFIIHIICWPISKKSKKLLF